MDDRFLPPYGTKANEKDANDFLIELREFFEEAETNTPDATRKARLHDRLRERSWFRQFACTAVADFRLPPGKHSDSPLIEEFRATLREFEDVMPWSRTQREPSSQEMRFYEIIQARFPGFLSNGGLGVGVAGRGADQCMSLPGCTLRFVATDSSQRRMMLRRGKSRTRRRRARSRRSLSGSAIVGFAQLDVRDRLQGKQSSDEDLISSEKSREV